MDLMTKTEPSLAETESSVADLPATIRGFLLEIGTLTFPVYGDAMNGWSIVRRDILDETPYRYGTLDELVFALFNFSLASGGDA